MSFASLDLLAIAHQAMIDAGFKPDMSESVLQELQNLKVSGSGTEPETRDLRALLWSSIDDAKSRDLDQVEYAESLPNGDVRLLVGIADVDALVKKDSPIDMHATENSTSVYTGVRTFPMLPEQLSTDMTSLIGGADRQSIVTEMVVGADGIVRQSNVYPAFLHNYAKLSYEAVGAWLDHNAAIPAEVAEVPKMEAQLRLQFAAAESLRELRTQHGALQLETRSEE